MKYGIDYGVKVDWSAYSKLQKVLCFIPIVNLFFSEKLNVGVTAMDPRGAPVYGTYATLRFPRDKRFGTYHIVSSLHDSNDYDGQTIRKVLVIIKRHEKSLGHTFHEVSGWHDVQLWKKYYVRKCGYTTKLNVEVK